MKRADLGVIKAPETEVKEVSMTSTFLKVEVFFFLLIKSKELLKVLICVKWQISFDSVHKIPQYWLGFIQGAFIQSLYFIWGCSYF